MDLHLLPLFGCRRPWAWTAFLIPLLLALPAAAAEAPTGEQIYRQRCASCHGEAGEGSKKYKHALVGDKTVAQLARRIANTMPKDSPQKCPRDDAEKVAAYIFEAFYSPAAQARNRPPRVELSRLTVRQYRNSVTDLVGTFRGPAPSEDRHGLHGEYFKSRRFSNRERVLDRVDPEVRFDFGTAGPDPEKFDANQFSIRWTGSVLAPETGTYEFIVRTEHAVRLWVNEPRKPLIDALVKSGNDTEYRASIFLLGGRAYPLRLEFSKAKQGVDDSKKKNVKPPEIKASVALLWKLPQQADEVIPERNLTPAQGPEVFVLTAPFPPDDRSLGYERGTTVSRAWDEATTEAAIETGDYVVHHLRELSGVADSAPDRKARLQDFGRRFAERAFRRPLTPEQQRLYVEHQFQAVADPETAVKRVVLAVLKSPRFLYRDLDEVPDGYDVASRLSFGLWDSLPDRDLLEAAAGGRLKTREQVAAQAERMLADPRAHAKLRAFFLQWLKVDPPPDVSKDPKQYPGFDRTLLTDLRASLELSLDDIVWGKDSDYRQLFLADSLYLNGRLAKFYGADLAADAPFRKVSLDPAERAGLLTHPYLMACFAYTGTSSPIHRGVFLARGVLGRLLHPPPAAFTPLPPEQHPDLTTRERVALQTKSESCVSCHGMINPLGFALEHFDAVGRFRDRENGHPIDATGTYLTRDGQTVRFNGARALGTFLAHSEETQDAFVEHLFHSLVQQPVLAYGRGELPGLRQSFAEHGYNMRRLVVDILATTALKPREDGS